MENKVYLVSGIDKNPFTQGIVFGEKMLKFGVGSRFLGIFSMPKKAKIEREIDLVSILNVENKFELAYILDNKFKKRHIETHANEIIQKFHKLDRMVFIGRRSGTINNIEYSQYIYGFKKGFLTETLLIDSLNV